MLGGYRANGIIGIYIKLKASIIIKGIYGTGAVKSHPGIFTARKFNRPPAYRLIYFYGADVDALLF